MIFSFCNWTLEWDLHFFLNRRFVFRKNSFQGKSKWLFVCFCSIHFLHEISLLQLQPSRSCTQCSCSSEENAKAGIEAKKTENAGVPFIPKIFFGTRTHKQIAQITRELRRTAYSSTRMTILSSRDHSCVHPTVSGCSNKNEKCLELLEAKDVSRFVWVFLKKKPKATATLLSSCLME